MSYTQKSYISPERTWKDNDSMIKSLLISSEEKERISNQKIPKSQFKDCFYHSKPIKFLCTS